LIALRFDRHAREPFFSQATMPVGATAKLMVPYAVANDGALLNRCKLAPRFVNTNPFLAGAVDMPIG